MGFLYANGKSVDLTLLLPQVDRYGFVGGYATAINIRDQVVGYQNILAQSFLYENGKALVFGMPNASTRAASINDFGQIVGSFVGNAEGALEHPFLRQPNGKMSDLGTFGGISARASAINDRGQIAINVDRADGSFHAVLVNPGGMIFQNLGKGTYANALNDLGQVVGGLNGHAIVYDRGSVQDLGSGAANDINNFGVIVGDGSGVTSGLTDLGFSGFVYFPAVGRRSLQDLTPGIFTNHSDTTGAGRSKDT